MYLTQAQQLFPKEKKQAAVTKLKIIRAFTFCIAKHGLTHITFDLLGNELNVSKSLIRYHFNNLDSLSFHAARFLFMKGSQMVDERQTKAESWQQHIEAVIDAAFDWYQDEPHCAPVLLSYYYFACIDPVYSHDYTRHRAIGEKRLVTILRQRAPRTERQELAQLANNIQNIIAGQLLDCACRQDLSQADHYRRQTTDKVFLLIREKLG